MSLPFLILTLLATSTLISADDSNVLLTGDVLTTDSTLSVPGATFVIQNDCNLVLYNSGSGFASNTGGYGSDCTLTLDNFGHLIINQLGSTVWTSPNPSGPSGKYAAVLRPDGQVAVYGPSVWSTPPTGFTSDNALQSEEATGDIPTVQNLLFSSQVLYNNATLTTRDYTFIMRDDCDLALIKAARGITWQSGTAGKGKNCFARLDHNGQLAVVGDRYKTVWSSKGGGKVGDYVLIMEITGQAVIYGPVVWTTASS